jgi:hypothetical protein
MLNRRVMPGNDNRKIPCNRLGERLAPEEV